MLIKVERTDGKKAYIETDRIECAYEVEDGLWHIITTLGYTIACGDVRGLEDALTAVQGNQ